MSNDAPTGERPLYRFRFGTAEFDQSRLELRVDGSVIALQQKPAEILNYLLSRVGEVVTKEELLEDVWSGRPTVENVIANAVMKLRAALGEENGARIVTLQRVGYRFDGPLERIAVGRINPGALQLESGATVPDRPHFVLEERLGHPDEGEVWRARQRKTGEYRVYKFAIDGAQLSALKREVTVSRLLAGSLGAREDFARVLDWNFETPPFFLECEYGGRDLLRWNEEGQHLQSMSLEQRLGLFLQVANAVSAAHGVGVLHKDLKPSNILVEPRTEGFQVRLTDFGSSRLIDPERLSRLDITRLGLTTVGASLGDSASFTPLYVAPELVAGGPSTIASDVYALGVILFQIVTADLRSPLASGWERAVDDALLRDDIARATDRDPAHRLSSVGELASRLRSLPARRVELQRQEATTAAALAAGEALRRTRERRPWLIAAVGALVMGMLASGAMWLRSERARYAAEKQAERAEATLRFLSDDLLGAVSPGGSGFEQDPTITQVLEYASTQMGDRLPADPTIRGSIHAALGQALRVLGNRERSAVELRQAVADYTLAFGASDETTLRARYALVHTLAYGNSADSFAEARRELEAADALADSRLLGDDELALAAAFGRGVLEFQQMRIEPALAAWNDADRLQRKLRPDDAQMAIVIRHYLADCTLRQGKREEAIAQLRATLADPALDATKVGASRVASLRAMLARALRNLGRYDEALPVAQAAAAVTEKLAGPDDYETLVQLSLVASIHDGAGRCRDALEVLRIVRSRMAARYGEDKQATLVETGNLGMSEYECGDASAGLDYIRRAEGELRRLYGENNVAAHHFRFFLARALVEKKRFNDALQMAEGLDVKALAAGDSKPGWEHRLNALRGEVLLGLGRAKEGKALLSTALPEVAALGIVDSDEIKRISALLSAP